MGEVIKDDICPNRSDDNCTRLFGQNCDDCGQLPVFADDSLYIVSSRSRFRNQLMIEDKFDKLKSYLNANGLQMNDVKTSLTEYMSCQKSCGIPPELTVRVIEKGALVDKMILDTPISRMLGINLQNNLCWSGHLLIGKKPLLPAIRRQIGALHSLSNVISKCGKLQLANALIMSQISHLYMG